MICVVLIKGVSHKTDLFRGIGANTSMLLEGLKELKDQNLEIVDKIDKADIAHYVKFNPFFISLPFFKPTKRIILTIHDLIMLIYPEHYPSGIKGWIKFQINKYLIKKHVDRIITISETSKKDICRFLGVKPEIVDVIYLAPKKAIKKLKGEVWKREIREKYNLPKNFVLFDHGVNYNKNLPTLINACKLTKIPLVIVGKETENIEKLDFNHPELCHLKSIDFSKVHKLGFVSDEDLNKLFNMTTIYVQPSFYEGFGMPVVEAMTVGTPVICSRTQALVEIAGDACLYFDTKSAKDLARKIKMFLNDQKLRSEYVKKGYEQVKKYSWEKAAKETLGVYEKA